MLARVSRVARSTLGGHLAHSGVAKPFRKVVAVVTVPAAWYTHAGCHILAPVGNRYYPGNFGHSSCTKKNCDTGAYTPELV